MSSKTLADYPTALIEKVCQGMPLNVAKSLRVQGVGFVIECMQGITEKGLTYTHEDGLICVRREGQHNYPSAWGRYGMSTDFDKKELAAILTKLAEYEQAQEEATHVYKSSRLTSIED